MSLITLPPILRHSIHRFLRFKQCGLRLIQIQFCMDALAFSLLLLAKRLLCLGALFEELSVQTLDELEGIIEHLSPVVERLLYNSSAAKKKVVFVFVSAGFKHS
jgi:hypothetical protein